MKVERDINNRIKIIYDKNMFTLEFDGAYEPAWLQLSVTEATLLRDQLDRFLAQYDSAT